MKFSAEQKLALAAAATIMALGCSNLAKAETLTGIVAAVDPGENEIGALVAKQMKRAHDNAIGRRAANRESALGHLAQTQRVVERKRMRNARLVIFRRDHPNVVGKHARDLLAHVEPFRMDTVVVGDKDAHDLEQFILPSRGEAAGERG
jgi:hypothetical protein